MDVMVHGQDFAVPLGIRRGMPTVPAVIVAERLWKMGFPFNARMRFADVTFSATDADFTVGQGRDVRGPIADIVMTLAGRRAGLAVE